MATQIILHNMDLFCEIVLWLTTQDIIINCRRVSKSFQMISYSNRLWPPAIRVYYTHAKYYDRYLRIFDGCVKHITIDVTVQTIEPFLKSIQYYDIQTIGLNFIKADNNFLFQLKTFKEYIDKFPIYLRKKITELHVSKDIDVNSATYVNLLALLPSITTLVLGRWICNTDLECRQLNTLLPSLTCLDFSSCTVLLDITVESIITNLLNLTKLYIPNLHSSIESLTLINNHKNINHLKFNTSTIYTMRLPDILTSMSITDLEITNVCEINNLLDAVSNLKELKRLTLHIKQPIDYICAEFPSKLIELYIYSFYNMDTIYQPDILRKIQQIKTLKKLIISNCSATEQYKKALCKQGCTNIQFIKTKI
jgi:hypothetical protein